MFTKCSIEVASSHLKQKIFLPGSLIDIGPGVKPQSLIPTQTHICVEPHLSYITKLKQERPKLIFIHGTWKEISKFFPDKSIDSVVALDVIEHMSREDGQLLILEALRVARHQIFLFTPCGDYPQSYQPGERDRWGMDGGYWQTHRSAWTPADFEGWDVVQVERFHDLGGGKFLDAMWVFKLL